MIRVCRMRCCSMLDLCWLCCQSCSASHSVCRVKFCAKALLCPTVGDLYIWFFCFFHISSLFTNVFLEETIKICANTLYDGDLVPPAFLLEIFIELMQTAASSIKFSFNETMYQQTNGVAMGSVLGSTLANILVGYQETKLFLNAKKLFMH